MSRDLWNPRFVDEAPLFSQLAPEVMRVDFSGFSAWPTLEDLNAILRERGIRQANDLKLTCVASQKPPRRRRRTGPAPMPYERAIFETGQLPTRPENWHDFFNVLAWLSFPRTKSAMNQRQVLAAKPVSPALRARGLVRCAEQDILTRLDEGGVAILTGLERGEEGSEAGRQAYILGHALFESAIKGQWDVRGLTIMVRDPSPSESEVDPRIRLAHVDRLLADKITRQDVSERDEGPPFYIAVGAQRITADSPSLSAMAIPSACPRPLQKEATAGTQGLASS